ncbi:MAG TPA: NAD(P)/FAD-dependent oxidoreductase [Bryobacteraceae bacterium]|nr:NAD(P)/FAD-dependent oxidoreductase [Bryobacteraceae bacterium]
MIETKADVFVIGGGPAGLAAAIAARRKGFKVAVADAARPPIDKACGEGLMPDSLAALRRLGVEIDADAGVAIRGIRFLGHGASVEANFPSGFGIAMRRTQLHQILARHAEQAGVTLLWGTRVAGIRDIPSCRWVIGADGQNSRVRREAGLDAATRCSFRFGFRRHYFARPWTDFVEAYWGPRCQIFVTPVSPEEICVALLCRDAHLRLDDVLPEFPELKHRLAGAAYSDLERGAVTYSRRLKRVFRDHTALIGDASGSVDAITGEGLGLSFRQAAALADALVSGNPAAYQAAHRRFASRPAFMASLMLQLDRSPWLCRGVLRAMAFQPAIFGGLLAIHIGRPEFAPAQAV